MYLLAHTGFTSGAAWLISRYSGGRENGANETRPNRSDLSRGLHDLQTGFRAYFWWLLFGSVLPDLIDKPVGLFLPKLGYGIGVGHTLLFAALLLMGGWILYHRGRKGFLYMALASCGHLVLDRVWDEPSVLLWPLLGVRFPKVGLPGMSQLHAWWLRLFTDPWVWGPEVIGAAILAGLAIYLAGSSRYAASGGIQNDRLSPAPVIWFTGLSGAGKSTIAKVLARRLRGEGYAVEVLDGDEVRARLSPGLGFSREDRELHNRRVAYVAGLLSRNGIIVLVPMISPYSQMRAAVRSELPLFIEVFVKCSLDECIRRDPKGLYKRALGGEIPSFTGLDDPYEEPVHPEIVVDTEAEAVEACVRRILQAVHEALPLRREDGQMAGECV
ncbi:MAG: adenylyl-sulfate kinase [Candidatus Methanomethyliaceae archaeon]